jgi:hypothetical protein
MSLPVPFVTYLAHDIESPTPLLPYPISRPDDEILVDVSAVPGIISVPDCNLYKTCQVCERGYTSTGIACPNCGHVNLR